MSDDPPGIYFSPPAWLRHDPASHVPGHPDRPERLEAIEQRLAHLGWLDWQRREAPALSDSELQLVHTAAHVRRIRELATAGGGAVDPDTHVGPESELAARHAAGGACALVRALLAGEAPTGLSAARPPGHHAERERAMGFCLYNSIALAAELALRELGLERVLIFDWDVHHGNGTAEAFRRSPEVLYASIHQSPLYPGTGAAQDTGSGAGEGFTINLPVPAGSDGELWLSLLDEIVLPAARDFQPQLILISAGYDAHELDPLGGCRLREEDYARMALRLGRLGQTLGAPVGAVLEGGYHPGALAACLQATMEALSGAPIGPDHRPG